MNNLTLTNQNGTWYADSREVAEMVDKEHKNLFRDIQGYCNILTGSNLSALDFFAESNYTDAKGEIRPCYLITRKGCDMVANKMTGEKGVLFTATYVTKFEEMEKQLVPRTREQVIQAGYQALLSLVDEMKPKAEFCDRVSKANGDMSVDEAAKAIGTGERKLFAWLRGQGILRQNNEPYQHYIGQGYFRLIVKTYPNRKTGEDVMYNQTLVTGKGLVWVQERWKEQDINKVVRLQEVRGM
jgi:Rha family phage regulatory protein